MTIAQIVHKLTTDQTFAQEVMTTTPENWSFNLSADDQAALQSVLERNWKTLCQTTLERLDEETWYQSSTT